jgi:hypothetical protein
MSLNDPKVAVAYNPTFWDKVRNFSAEDFIYHILSEKWCGNDCVPLDHRTLYIDSEGCKYVFSFLNDSFEIGIGYPEKWHGIYRRECIHKFIFWYLRNYIFGEWFGLRRYIWYKLLHRKVKKHLKYARKA